MPIYPFVCNICGNETEKIMKLSEAESEMILPCDHCEEDTLHKKVLGNTSFELKGEGWAADGYEYPTTQCEASKRRKTGKIRMTGKKMNPLMDYAGKGMLKK